MKTYKLWIDIEEYDSETERYANITNEVSESGAFAEPVPMGTFDTIEEATEAAESMDGHFEE